MYNVRDAANYLIKLYYYDNRECTCSSVQKLLFIAQLYSLYVYKKPLFEDSLLIRQYSFAIPLIASTYSDIIFRKNEQTTALYDDYNEYTEIITKPDLSIEKHPLSSFYWVGDISNEEMELLDLIYCHFGAYSGKCLGRFITELKLHNLEEIGKEVDIKKLERYLKNIPTEDKKNIIIKFIKNGAKEKNKIYIVKPKRVSVSKINYIDNNMKIETIIKKYKNSKQNK